jgi:hypothetical protein
MILHARKWSGIARLSRWKIQKTSSVVVSPATVSAADGSWQVPPDMPRQRFQSHARMQADEEYREGFRHGLFFFSLANDLGGFEKRGELNMIILFRHHYITS